MSQQNQNQNIYLLMKNPEVKLNGVTGFKQSNLDQYFTNDDISLHAEGQLAAQIWFCK
jgi:hypothetical protein